MNKIRINRLVWAGLVTFFVWIVVEILVEQVIGNILFGKFFEEQILQATTIPSWGVHNVILNILIAVLNCTVLIWLYASLRPMFGVGIKTALITCALGIIWGLSQILNGVNLGIVSAQVGMTEFIYELIEFPIAMIAGAYVYEGASQAGGS